MTETVTETPPATTEAVTPEVAAQPARAPRSRGRRKPAAQADSGAAADAVPGQNPRQPRPQGQNPRNSPPRGARPPRAADAVLEKLFELYPRMFGARFLPLKLGVYQDLLALHPDEFKKEDLKIAMGLHARSTRYLESVAAGEKRHDLSGNPVEDVAPEHVHHAIMEVFRRRQARSKDDLRPWLRDRLVAAIQASGLSREDYVLRVPTPDPQAAAALDEAFAAIAGQSAKREALVRAYRASGKTVEEFADMYGMDPAAVNQALAAQDAAKAA